MDSMLVMATFISLLLGTIMSAIAWRLLRQSADRRAARVEALQAAASDESAPETPTPVLDLQYAAPPAVDARFFATPERMPASRWQARMAVVLAIVACAAVPYALYQLGVFSAIATAAPAGRAQPIELLSLRHTVDDTGSFTVTGLVQNPQGGRKTSAIVAVVYLFDDAGRFMATGRAGLDVPSLEAGEEGTFTVTIPKTAGVGRYRVGFRLADGGVVAHLDRRGQAPGETTEDAVGGGPGRSPAPMLAPRRSEGE